MTKGVEDGMGAKQRVLAVYPHASAWRGWGEAGLIAIWEGLRNQSKQLSRHHFDTEEAAWDDAAERLPIPSAPVTTETAEEAWNRGYETGCKDAIFDETGCQLDSVEVPPYTPPSARSESATTEVRGKASPESPEEAFRRGQLVVLEYVAANFDSQIDWASPLGSLRNCPPFPYIAPNHIEGKG
jgi:hypothetical protein